MKPGIPEAPPRPSEAPARHGDAPAASHPLLLRIDVDAGPALYVWQVRSDGSFTVTADLARAMRFEVADPALLARVSAEAQKWPLCPVASYGAEGP